MLSIRGYSDPIAWQPKAIDQLPPAPAGAVGPAPVVGAPPAQERAEGLVRLKGTSSRYSPTHFHFSHR